MTEAEWNACNDPTPMLALLRDKASERKLRLFAVACCARISRLMQDPRSQNAVTVSERRADDSATPQELEAACMAAAMVKGAHRHAADAEENAALSAVLAAEERLTVDLQAPSYAVFAVGLDFGNEASQLDPGIVSGMSGDAVRAFHSREDREKKYQAGLLRDVFDNPFHPATLSLSCLAWNDGAIRKMAQSIYDDRAYHRLPLLADALEDAGCADDASLSHCRTPGEHVRGCWVIDMLLGKE